MRTEIASLGEFGLIDRLTEGIKLENESSKYGVGDDAAVLSYPSEKQVLVTTDLLMEGVHFDLTYVPLKHLGYKSAVVNFSDIYAMNIMSTLWEVILLPPLQGLLSASLVSAMPTRIK